MENRPGGNSVPGTVAGRNAAPDGYTLTFATSSSIAVNRAIYKQLPYDPPKHFAMVQGVFSVPWVIVAYPSTPYGTFKEMIDAAKRSSNALSWRYCATSLRTGASITGVFLQGQQPGDQRPRWGKWTDVARKANVSED